MKIYIPSHLRNIKVVDDFCRLIEQYNKENSNSDQKDSYYYYYKHLNYDPVKRFVGICIPTQENEEEVYTNIVNYLTGLFYCTKGSTKVFEYLRSHLKLDGIFDYNMKLGSLSITLENVPISVDEELFRKTFEDFLKSLLYLKTINIYIDSFTVSITKNQELVEKINLITYQNWGVVDDNIEEEK